MSFYIQGPTKGKVDFLIANMEGTIIPDHEVEEWIDDKDQAVVCVIDNGLFEAAIFVYCLGEHEQGLGEIAAGDTRPRTHVLANRKLVEAASDYH